MKGLKSVFGRSLGVGHYIFAFVFLIRVMVLARLTLSPFLLPLRGDMHFYDDWARRILQGHLTDHLAFYGLPLYAYVLALIYKLVGYGPFIPGLLQAGLDAGTALILYKLGVRVFAANDHGDRPAYLRRGAVIGILAAVGWAFFAPAQTYAVILMPTAWFVFAFWFVIWRLVRNNFMSIPSECLFLGLLIGVTAMGIAMILFLIPLILIALVLKGRIDNQTRAKTIACGAVLLFAGITAGTAPCWIHNYFIAHDPVFLSAHSGVNFWVGNNPMATGYPRFPPGLHAGQEVMLKDSVKAAEKAAGHSLKRSEVSAYWSVKAKSYIRDHFGDWLKLIAIKIKNFWNAFQYDDLSMITALREHGVIFPVLRFGIVAALAIPGLLLAWRLFPLSRWITAAIALEMFAILPVFITERYRLAAVPGLLLFAACGLSIFWQACASHKIRVAAIYIALLVGSTIFVAWPQREPSLWALDSYNSGWQALESNDLVTAERKLNIAYAYVPENAETNFALGNLHLARSEATEAKSYYLATLRLDPTHEGAYNNLGVLALQEERWSVAANFFNRALAQDPQNAKTYYLLAQSHFRAGNIESASTEITEALKLNPTPPEFRDLQEKVEIAKHDDIDN